MSESLGTADPTPPSIGSSAVRNSADGSGSAVPLASPIVKWAGGKTKLLPEIRARIPEMFRNYYEPFVGGGAVFFDLACRLRKRGSRARLGDLNAGLIELYRGVRDDPEALRLHLDVCERLHDERGEEAYYACRDGWNHLRDTWHPIRRAATFLYLNRACYNGLWRENKDGGFNVPSGKVKRLGLPSLARLQAAAAALAQVDLWPASFVTCTRDVGAGDFIYFDPPYLPSSATANFSSYGKDGFGQSDHRMLADCTRELVARGAHVMLSQADTPLARELYASFHVERIAAPRSIAADGAKRVPAGELLITSYAT